MNSRTYSNRGSRGLMVFTALLVAAGTFVSVALNPFAARKRAKLARDMNNARQIKLALDTFAIDFGGQYPNEDTGERIVQGGTGTKDSNGYFRQLFGAGHLQTESLFWVKGATVCSKAKPDEVVHKGGKPVMAEILKGGDCGWAYVTNQTNTSHLGRPLLLSAFVKGTKGFDKKLYGGKIPVLRIDGSMNAMELSAQGALTENGEDILSAKAAPWNKSGEDPSKLLKQPKPAAAAAKKKPAPAAKP